MQHQSRFYSMRKLNPYQGVIQVVEVDGFRAMSNDGIEWQLRAHRPGSRYAVYGWWRQGEEIPVTRTRQTESFIEAMSSLPDLPFPLQDHLELWLLDAQGQMPLALVASLLPREVPPQFDRAQWLATAPEDDAFFSTGFSSANALPESRSPITHGEILRRCVQLAAGAQPRAQWFLRRADRSGEALSVVGPPLQAQRKILEAENFPSLIISETGWEDEGVEALVRDYHHFHAADLLTQDNLSANMRDRLERVAAREAVKVYQRRKVLAQVRNTDLMQVAFVQGRLHQLNQPGKQG